MKKFISEQEENNIIFPVPIGNFLQASVTL